MRISASDNHMRAAPRIGDARHAGCLGGLLRRQIAHSAPGRPPMSEQLVVRGTDDPANPIARESRLPLATERAVKGACAPRCDHRSGGVGDG